MTTHDPFSRSAYAPNLGMYASQRVPVAPVSRVARTAYLLSWSLVGVAAVAGCLFSLYRNDVLLNEARRRGLETPYLALERKLVGTPGWGTPRSLAAEASIAEQAAAPSALPAAQGAAPSIATAAALSVPMHASEPAATPAAKPTQAEPTERATADGVKITSLDALAPLPAAPAAPAPAAPAVTRAAPVRSAVSEPKSAPARSVAKESKSVAPARVILESEPEKKPAQTTAAAAKPTAKPAAAPPKPAPPPADDNPLKAAIRSAIAKDSK
ncbi:MAG: hypothetical protein ACOY0T_03550 [Myxococcota bacterium]